MKNSIKLKTLLAACSLMAAASAQAEPTMANAQAMAWQCAPCHGTNGQEFKEAMPPLAGMPAQQFIDAMTAYREGTRAAVIMDRVARGFTDDEIKAMAIWFEKQPVKQWDKTSLTESLEAQASAAATGGQK
ncbi:MULTISPECIES: c-type cytochrome [Thiomicrorhabdus]|uniref:C-type cytochrome n=1 Tax=Thiomicrorhabdus heinhorstiae TaxID=2748010 RepID=A0ABS0BZF6_9GAMM|nr:MULTISPECIES: c-type cytochrome [Thiomicrorhabdus]MBF6057361.1 c-type cytochrome [Thiomicrorhabdus heinhorstiae]